MLLNDSYCIKQINTNSNIFSKNIEQKRCSLIKCLINDKDKKWTEWLGWSKCDSRCEPGRKYNYRTCIGGYGKCQGLPYKFTDCGDKCSGKT